MSGLDLIAILPDRLASGETNQRKIPIYFQFDFITPRGLLQEWCICEIVPLFPIRKRVCIEGTIKYCNDFAINHHVVRFVARLTMAFQPTTVEGGHDLDIKGPDCPNSTHGTNPNFETYLYYAQRQREREATESKSHDMEMGFWAKILFGEKYLAVRDEKKGDATASISDAEYRAASSTLRTASWGSVFYLITTGP